MEVRTIYALFDKKLPPDAAICEVIAIKTTDKRLILDETIINNFFGNTLIYVPQFYVNNDFIDINKYQIVEIPFKDVFRDEKPYPKVHHNGVRKSKLKCAIEIKDTYIKGQSIDAIELGRSLPADLLKYISGSFYFSTHDIIYGPFVFSQETKNFRPEKGKEVQKSRIDLGKIIEHPYQSDVIILLGDPIEQLDEIDCSTNDQLIQWIKDKVRYFQDSQLVIEVLNRLRKRLSEELFNGIDLIRYERVRPLLDTVILNFEELETIKKDEAWNNIFNVAFEKYKHEYKDQIEISFQARLQEQEKHLTELNDAVEAKEEEILRLQENIEHLTLEKQSLNEEIQHLTTNRQKIVQDLRLQLELTTLKKAHKQLHEVLEFSNPSEIYYNDTGEDDFVDNLENLGVPRAGDLNHGIETLRSKKFILGYDINFTLALIRSIGNAKAYLQQAEGDWLKFEKWYSNGLAAIIDNAISHPKTMHFYILQDYNIASPECYAKPIIDICRGIRKKVPGTDNQWPKNLWIVFIPLEVDIDEFGFEINEETFKNWDKLPESKMKRIYEFRLPKIWNLV